MSKTRATKPAAKKEEKSSSAESGSSNKPEMKTSEIRDLIDFISKSGLNEVNIETKELKISVKRDPDQKVFKSSPAVTHAAPIQAVAAAAPVAPAVNTGAAAPKAEAPAAPSGKKTVEIK